MAKNTTKIELSLSKKNHENHFGPCFLGSGFRVIKFEGRRVLGLSSFGVVEFWDCRVLGLSSFRVVEFSGC